MIHSTHPTIPATDYPRDTQPTPCESTWRCSPALASMVAAEPDLRRMREEARRYERMAARWERLRVIDVQGEAVSDG